MTNDEQIIYVFRKHWITLFTTLMTIVFALVMPLLLAWYAIALHLLPPFITSDAVDITCMIWIVITWSALAFVWTSYYFNTWTITDRRIVCIEQSAFFNRQIISWEIHNLQEIIAHEEGFLQSILHYGTLEIRTAGSNDGTEHFDGVPNPGAIRDIILAQGSNFDRLVASKESNEQLLHTVSHEVKGYLTKNQAALAGIVEGDFGEVPDNVRAMATSALSDTRRGVSTVMDILHGGTEVMIQRVPTDMAEVVREIVDALRPQAESKGLQYVVHIYPGNYSTNADGPKLGNIVFKNMIDNAIRYTPQGTVSIELTHEPSAIRFSVTDSGVGMSQTDMQQLFTDGGHGAHSQDINPESTGFGMAASKRIVEAHGGRMWAESEGAGKGSRFVAELPTN